MNQRDTQAYKHFLAAYKHQWDLNRYMRTNYDDDLEYYMSYRPANRYPLVYNTSFNKLLPKIQTILSRFMDQLYQAGTGNLISVRPRKSADVERAKRVTGLLNHQLETLNDIDCQGGSYLFNFKWMFNALTFGKGIAKMYWHKEDRIMPRRLEMPVPQFDDMGRLVGYEMVMQIQEEMQNVYNGPYAEVLHNKLFVPHPHYRSIQKMPFVFCVYKRSIDYIKQQIDKGVFEKRGMQDIGWSSSVLPNRGGDTIDGSDSAEAFAKSIEIEGATSYEELRTDRISPEIDVIEGYGKYIFPEDDAPYEVGSGVKIKGKESEAIVHIANYKSLLKIQKNKYEIRPFFDIGCYYNPEMYWDMGIVRLGKGVQEHYDTFANTRIQNAIMTVNQMLKVKEDSDIDPRALVWKPYGIIPVEEMDDVMPLVQPDSSQSIAFQQQEKFFDETLQDMTGMYDYNMGATPSRQEHVGTIYSLQSMGEARTRLLLMTMDHTGFRPFLKHMMLLNMWHLPPNYETRINTSTGEEFAPLYNGDIHVDYDFSARYTGLEPALGKQFRAQQLVQYAQMWAESPLLQHREFMKAILELMDFPNTDRYLKTDQQVMQEQMMAQQGAIQQAMFEDQIQAKKDERQLFGDVAKGLLQ